MSRSVPTASACRRARRRRRSRGRRRRGGRAAVAAGPVDRDRVGDVEDELVAGGGVFELDANGEEGLAKGRREVERAVGAGLQVLHLGAFEDGHQHAGREQLEEGAAGFAGVPRAGSSRTTRPSERPEGMCPREMPRSIAPMKPMETMPWVLEGCGSKRRTPMLETKRVPTGDADARLDPGARGVHVEEDLHGRAEGKGGRGKCSGEAERAREGKRAQFMIGSP